MKKRLAVTSTSRRSIRSYSFIYIYTLTRRIKKVLMISVHSAMHGMVLGRGLDSIYTYTNIHSNSKMSSVPPGVF